MALEELYNEAKEEMIWLKLGDGESFVGEFVGVEKVKGLRGQDTREYTFISENGKEKKLTTSSFSLLQSLVSAGVKEGDKVKITRRGLDTNTRYEAVKLSS